MGDRERSFGWVREGRNPPALWRERSDWRTIFREEHPGGVLREEEIARNTGISRRGVSVRNPWEGAGGSQPSCLMEGAKRLEDDFSRGTPQWGVTRRRNRPEHRNFPKGSFGAELHGIIVEVALHQHDGGALVAGAGGQIAQGADQVGELAGRGALGDHAALQRGAVLGGDTGGDGVL